MTAFLALAFCQSVELPATIRAQVGAFVLVKPVRLEGGKAVRYFTSDDQYLSVFPSELLTDSTATVLVASKQGRYKVFAVTAAGDKISSVASTIIVVGDGVDPDPLPPQPKPPQPKPDDPKPDDPKPTPAPIPLPGLRVMIVYDSAKLAEMPKEQQAILFGAETRGLLNQKCVADEQGNASWRIYPKVTDISNADKVWQDAIARPRASVPWVVVSNGKTGFEGPLPANAAQFMELVKKYAE